MTLPRGCFFSPKVFRLSVCKFFKEVLHHHCCLNTFLKFFRTADWISLSLLPRNEEYPNKKLFLVLIFLQSDWIRRANPYLSVFSPNTGKCGLEITRYLDTFHAVQCGLQNKQNTRQANTCGLEHEVQINYWIALVVLLTLNMTLPAGYYS